MASKLTQIASERSGLDLQFFSQGSISWLNKKVSELRNPARVALEIKKETGRYRNTFSPGRMYFFSYDPKGKRDLPYYDAFPLVLVLQMEGDGFLGLNMHYLPLKYRVVFLDKLMDYADYDDGNNVTRLRISYDILTASRQYKEFRPCIKKYLMSGVRSKILAIDSKEWEVAVFLPVQNFKKEPANLVWQESMKEIRKS
jgi:hypothetical protein